MLVFTDIILSCCSVKKENENEKEGRRGRKRHGGDATPAAVAATGLEAIIQLVKVSAYIMTHKTNVITRTKLLSAVERKES